MQTENTAKKSAFSSALWFILIVGGTMAAGFLSGVLSGASAGYEGYARPPLTPPDTTFAIVWPVLYFLTGTSFYLMLNAAVSEKNVAVKKASLIIWTVQLALNLAWPFIFFSLNLKTVAFIISSFITVCLIAVFMAGWMVNGWRMSADSTTEKLSAVQAEADHFRDATKKGVY